MANGEAWLESSQKLLLQMRQSPTFDTTQALDDVSLDLYPGEIHALLGENGAGKSTLIKIMTGVYHPDEGQILLDGKPIRVNNSVEAQAYGIAAIYQEPMIFPDLNVAENIFITHRSRSPVVNGTRCPARRTRSWRSSVSSSTCECRRAG
jgi:rhamnose transport system ATP-binding protein